MDRRTFINVGLVAGGAVAGAGSQALAADKDEVKIVGISCSPRKGMKTVTGIKASLEAAGATGDNITTELIDLGEISFSG